MRETFLKGIPGWRRPLDTLDLLVFPFSSSRGRGPTILMSKCLTLMIKQSWTHQYFPSSQWDPSFCMPPTQWPVCGCAGLTLAHTVLTRLRRRAVGAILLMVHSLNPVPCMDASLWKVKPGRTLRRNCEPLVGKTAMYPHLCFPL